jgi:hypothetical protein
MEPDAIWIYHTDGRSSFERITPEGANGKGWSALPDFSDMGNNPVESKYTCEICGAGFDHHLALAGHKRSHK